MRRAFTCGDDIIVTTAANANDLRMIYSARRYWYPRCGSWLMTGFTKICGSDVCGILTGRNDTIMTIKTGLPCYRGMIKINNPVIRRMTGIARLDGNDMVNSFTACNHIVMATFTCTNNLRMVGSTGW